MRLSRVSVFSAFPFVLAAALAAQTLHERSPARPIAVRYPAASAAPVLPAGTNLQVEALHRYPLRAPVLKPENQ